MSPQSVDLDDSILLFSCGLSTADAGTNFRDFPGTLSRCEFLKTVEWLGLWLHVENAIIGRCPRLPAAIGAFGRIVETTNDNVPDQHALRVQLQQLQQEHRDLDAAINALQQAPGSDLIQLQRLKKRKLVLKDKIGFIEDQLTPDIIA
jgi:hypothetical protein